MVTPLLASFLAVVQVAQAALPPVDVDYLNYVRPALRTCGIEAEPRLIEEGPLLGEYEVRLDQPGVTAASVECLATTLSLDGLAFDFADSGLADVFDAARASRPDIRAAREDNLQRVRQWLAEQGRLADRPRLAVGQAVSTFSTTVERYCGVEPGALLRADDAARSVTVAAHGAPGFDQVGCAFAIVTLAAAEDAPDLAVAVEGEDAD